jgi:hypothetical protein
LDGGRQTADDGPAGHRIQEGANRPAPALETMRAKTERVRDRPDLWRYE